MQTENNRISWGLVIIGAILHCNLGCVTVCRGGQVSKRKIYSISTFGVKTGLPGIGGGGGGDSEVQFIGNTPTLTRVSFPVFCQHVATRV